MRYRCFVIRATGAESLPHDAPSGSIHLHGQPAAFATDVLGRQVHTELARGITLRTADEATAVPDWRFTLLRRAGFTRAVRMCLLPDE